VSDLDEKLRQAKVLKSEKHLTESESLCREILQSQPNHPGALHLLAILLTMQQRRPEAIEVYRQALHEQPSLPEAWVNLGAALRSTGKTHEAAAALQKAIDLRPDLFEAWFNLGNARLELNQWKAAAEAFATAARLRPGFADAWLNLGVAKMRDGAIPEAIEALDRATKVNPKLALAWINAGAALRVLEKNEQAVQYLRRGVELDPQNAEAFQQLGGALRAIGEYESAAEALRKTVALRPTNGDTLIKLSALLQDIGRIPESFEWCEKYLQLNPADVEIADYRLCLLYLHPDFTPTKIFQEHLEWDKRFGATVATQLPPRPPHGRMRIGYVSPDFRLHSVAFFLEGLLESHDADQFEIYCYSDVEQPDEVTERLKNLSHHWRQIQGKSNDDVAQLIATDEIDILVDLAGHTAGNRLQVFSRRVAPVQAAYLGYLGTTGLRQMDYRLTDAYADPPGNAEPFYTEKLIRLPRTLACYKAWEKSAQPKISQRAHPTFGSFTVLRKVNDDLLDTWGEILSKVPGSRLFLGARGLADRAVRQRIAGALARRRVSEDRITFQDLVPLEIYLEAHHQVDVLLDTFPVNGHTVVCHALWMGVPVITLAGDAYCQRLASSVLNTLDLGQWIANSRQEYVDLATKLAADLPRLDLRQRMRASPLMDSAQFARDVEEIYRRISVR
jgi:protein O-GlcNAc transferase